MATVNKSYPQLKNDERVHLHTIRNFIHMTSEDFEYIIKTDWQAIRCETGSCNKFQGRGHVYTMRVLTCEIVARVV